MLSSRASDGRLTINLCAIIYSWLRNRISHIPIGRQCNKSIFGGVGPPDSSRPPFQHTLVCLRRSHYHFHRYAILDRGDQDSNLGSPCGTLRLATSQQALQPTALSGHALKSMPSSVGWSLHVVADWPLGTPWVNPLPSGGRPQVGDGPEFVTVHAGWS